MSETTHADVPQPQLPPWIGYRVRGAKFKHSTQRWHDQWDRYIVPARDHHEHQGQCGCGVGLTRMTTATKATSDESTLIDYLGRHTAKGFALNPDLREQAEQLPLPGEQGPDSPLTDADIRRLWKDLCAEAKRRGGGDEAADMGTFLHEITEAIDLGKIEVSGVELYVAEAVRVGTITSEQGEKYDWPALAQAWVDLRDEHFEVFPELTEVTIRNFDYDWTGTADRIVVDKLDGRWKVADLKTGSITWDAGKFAAQEAGYAVGDVEIVRFDAPVPFYDPLPEGLAQDEGLIICIPINSPDDAAVYRVPLTRAAEDTLPLSAAVIQERRESKATQLECVGTLRDLRRKAAPQAPEPAAAPVAVPSQGSGRKCGVCREPGHTARTCPQNTRPAVLDDTPVDNRSEWERAVDEVAVPSPAAFAEIKARAGEAWTPELVDRARARLGLPPKLVGAAS